MKRTVLIGAVAIALVASACGASEAGGSASADTASSQPATTTTPVSTVTDPAESSTTTVPPTTIAPTTTATTAVPTTTIAGPTEEQGFEELTRSLEISDEVVSGRMEGSMLMTGLDPEESGVSEAEFLFASAFDDETGDNMFMMDMSSLSAAMDEATDETGFDASLLGKFETRQIGDRVFLNMPFFSTMLGSETEWISMPVEESDQFTGGFEDFPSDPGEIMDSYGGADASMETVGPEDVNGVSAIHYRVTLDSAGLIEQMSPNEQEAAGESPFVAEGVVPLDLWVSDDGYVVRMVIEINADMVETSTDDEFGSFVMEFNMFDINERVVVPEPPAADVTAIEDLEPAFDLDLDG